MRRQTLIMEDPMSLFGLGGSVGQFLDWLVCWFIRYCTILNSNKCRQLSVWFGISLYCTIPRTETL